VLWVLALPKKKTIKNSPIFSSRFHLRPNKNKKELKPIDTLSLFVQYTEGREATQEKEERRVRQGETRTIFIATPISYATSNSVRFQSKSSKTR
jgi:hypothetical protein